MNSKIAVIALVLIVAVPILVGYGMNFQDIEKSEYQPTSNQNINNLLNNAVSWSYTPSNAYSLNAKNIELSNGQLIYPFYYGTPSEKPTSMQVGKDGVYAAGDLVVTLAPEYHGQVIPIISPDAPNAFFDMTIGTQLNINTMIQNVIGAYWSDNVMYVLHSVAGVIQTTTFAEPAFYYATVPTWIEYSPGSDYIDPIKGWTINQPGLDMANMLVGWRSSALSNYVFFTVDLGGMETYRSTFVSPIITTDRGTTTELGTQITFSVVAASGSETSSHLELNGTRVPFVVDPDDPTKLAEDSNVWQVGVSQTGITAYYVSSWPARYGLSTYYQTVTLPIGVDSDPITIEFSGLKIEDINNTRFRVDYATQRNNRFDVIQNVQYDPNRIIQDNTASYRITIPYVDIVGTSITWGGVTYPVVDGKITVSNNTKIAVDKLQLDSIYEDGERVNLINGKRVSTGEYPIEFGGMWSAAVFQSTLTLKEWTSNEWVAGGFAWNGIDESFSLIGLLTCVGVFIGLGMYGARSGAKVGTLMLICGGAALIFLALI